MPNPFAQMNPINAYSGNMGNIRSAYQAIAGSSNPMQAFSKIASQNPAMQPILNALRNGADPQRLFNTLCQQRGINPQEFLRSITNNNG